MKPKDALIKDGTVPTKPGKGRMNAAQIDRCKELAAQGWNIDGYTTTKSVTNEVTVTKSSVYGNKQIPDIPDARRSEDDWNAFVWENGKEKAVGFRTVEETCGNSLGWCWCDKPTVRVDWNRVSVVHFKPTA